MPKSEIIGVRWITTQKGTIGIVLLYDSITKKNKAYIGIAEGDDAEVDKEHIRSWGAPFPADIAERLIRGS